MKFLAQNMILIDEQQLSSMSILKLRQQRLKAVVILSLSLVKLDICIKYRFLLKRF